MKLLRIPWWWWWWWRWWWWWWWCWWWWWWWWWRCFVLICTCVIIVLLFIISYYTYHCLLLLCTPTDGGWWSEGWQRKTWEGKVFCNPKSTDSVANSVPFCLAVDRLEFSPCTAASKFNQGISLSQVAAVLWRGILAFAAAVEVCHPFFDHTGGDSLYRNTIPPTTKGPGSTENFGGGLFLISAIPKLENHVEIILRFRAVEGKITIIQPIYRWYMLVFSFVYIYISDTLPRVPNFPLRLLVLLESASYIRFSIMEPLGCHWLTDDQKPRLQWFKVGEFTYENIVFEMLGGKPLHAWSPYSCVYYGFTFTDTCYFETRRQQVDSDLAFWRSQTWSLWRWSESKRSY